MHNALTQRIPTDYAVPPGETLAEVLDERGMTQSDALHASCNKVMPGYDGRSCETELSCLILFGNLLPEAGNFALILLFAHEASHSVSVLATLQ